MSNKNKPPLDILIADDEFLARETIKSLLHECNWKGNIFEAHNGKVALEVIGKYHPDIVFLDIEMPILTGLEVAAKIPKDTSLVFVTAFSHFSNEAISFGSIDYLLKPFKDESFFKALSKAVEIQRDKLANEAPEQT